MDGMRGGIANNFLYFLLYFLMASLQHINEETERLGLKISFMSIASPNADAIGEAVH